MCESMLRKPFFVNGLGKRIGCIHGSVTDEITGDVWRKQNMMNEEILGKRQAYRDDNPLRTTFHFPLMIDELHDCQTPRNSKCEAWHWESAT